MRFILLLLVTVPLTGQSPDSVCTAIRQLSVGAWAEYELHGVGGREAHGRMRNAVVGTELRGDTTFWWHESFVRADEGTLIIKSLIPGYPFDARQVRDLIMKMNDEPPTRMPEYMLAMMRTGDGPPDHAYLSVSECASAENLGWEELDTPVGTVRALHSRTATPDGEAVDVWMTPAVPFGIVRLSGGGVELVLLGHGTGATSAITEPPQEMR